MSVKIIEQGGAVREVPVSVEMYKAASEKHLSLPQYLQREYGANTDKAFANGSVFHQMLASINMDIDGDKSTGFRSAKLADVLDGTISAAITRDAVPASRILAPAAILDIMEANKQEDRSSDLAFFEKMVAVDTTIANDRFEQPVFDASNADKQQMSAISQLATANIVGKLTVSQTAHAIPTFAYGLEISDKAKKAYTIDQVAIYLNRLRSTLALNRLDSQLSALVNGDEDFGMAALVAKSASTFDSAATGGKLTHRAYIKWLRENRRLRTIDYVLCDMDTYFKIVDREGRPTVNTKPVESTEQLAHNARPVNVELYEPQIFVVNDGVLPTNTLYGLDSTGAIARVKNSEADYQATEELVMRKGTAMRFDDGQVVYRHDDQAWTALTLA